MFFLVEIFPVREAQKLITTPLFLETDTVLQGFMSAKMLLHIAACQALQDRTLNMLKESPHRLRLFAQRRPMHIRCASSVHVQKPVGKVISRRDES